MGCRAVPAIRDRANTAVDRSDSADRTGRSAAHRGPGVRTGKQHRSAPAAVAPRSRTAGYLDLSDSWGTRTLRSRPAFDDVCIAALTEGQSAQQCHSQQFCSFPNTSSGHTIPPSAWVGTIASLPEDCCRLRTRQTPLAPGCRQGSCPPRWRRRLPGGHRRS